VLWFLNELQGEWTVRRHSLKSGSPWTSPDRLVPCIAISDGSAVHWKTAIRSISPSINTLITICEANEYQNPFSNNEFALNRVYKDGKLEKKWGRKGEKKRQRHERKEEEVKLRVQWKNSSPASGCEWSEIHWRLHRLCIACARHFDVSLYPSKRSVLISHLLLFTVLCESRNIM